MKKQKAFTLPKISADNIAKQLRKTLGLDKARKIAEYYNKTVGFHPKSNDPLIKLDDVDATLITRKEVVKNAHVWRQVHGILANQKGFTAFELLFCLALAASLCIGAFGLYTLAHFIGKFW